MQDVVGQVAPSRIGRLGGAQAGQAEGDGTLEPVAGDELAQAPDVVEIEIPRLGLAVRRRLREIRRVPLDHLLADRPPECAAEHAVDVPGLGRADAAIQRP